MFLTIWIERLVIPCSVRQKLGCIQKCNAYRNVEETRTFDPWLISIIPKAIENENLKSRALVFDP